MQSQTRGTGWLWLNSFFGRREGRQEYNSRVSYMIASRTSPPQEQCGKGCACQLLGRTTACTMPARKRAESAPASPAVLFRDIARIHVRAQRLELGRIDATVTQ